jgi:YD repeat-containing protein
MEISPISPMVLNPPFGNKIEYDLRTFKVTTKVSEDYQQQTIYTYDKYGRLINSVVRKDAISEIL